MFVEHSHLTMPSSVWLHVNGVSLTTDTHQYQPPVHTYDYRTKHLHSPVPPPTPPLVSPPAVAPYSITIIDGPFNDNNNHNVNKQCHKVENSDTPKKFFVARQIRKVKSLPGLIKGTALSRHTPLQSSTFTSPPPPNTSVNSSQDDQMPVVTVDPDDDSPQVSKPIENDNKTTRRPRVYFADVNKVHFIDGNNEVSQEQQSTTNNSNQRRRRLRLTKKPSNSNNTNHLTPSIQQPQILQNSSRPLSRQTHHPVGQELSIKKQQLLASPRVHSSRPSHLPEISNHTILNESSSNENSNGKYVLQREKPLVRLSKQSIHTPTNGTNDSTNENSNGDMSHGTPTLISFNQNHENELSENGVKTQNNSILSATLNNRQRSSLNTISLRQQFLSPIKTKGIILTQTINTHNNKHNFQQLNSCRSASLRNSNLRIHDEDDDPCTNVSTLTVDNRPMTGNGPTKQLKRSDVIHYNSKTPFGTNSINDSNKSHNHEPKEERFQNILTVVRPPYAAGNGTSSNTLHELALQQPNHNHQTGNVRSSRSLSARLPFGFPLTSNTIIV